MITIRTFGYKHENPRLTSAFVLDCRGLPNPHAVPELKLLTGLDEVVQHYVARESEDFQALMFRGGIYAEHIDNTGDTLLIGCHGGRHRSVAVAEILAKHLRNIGLDVSVTHPYISQ